VRFSFLARNKINNLPKTAGVYAFFDQKEEFLYIGKAANLRNRVKNHFNQPTYKDEMFLEIIKKIGYIKTNSEIEALLLESKLIKEYQPKFNTLWRDDKNYFYVAITNKGHIFLTHQPKNVSSIKYHVSSIKIPDTKFIGPFVDGQAIKKTLRILRKVFPYYTQKKHPQNLCPYCHLGLCPGPEPDVKKLKKGLNNLKKVLLGKKDFVLKSLKKEMKQSSKEQNFEQAAELRDKIWALEKTISNARIFEDFGSAALRNVPPRIEGYDISNIQGQLATGSMVVFINGKPAKNLYRKFKIKFKNPPAGGPNDTAMIKEVLRRRLKHQEWPFPDFILIDGGKPQINAGISIKYQVLSIRNIKFIALAKKNNELFIEGEKKPILLKNLPSEIANLILRVRDEAHRFAISYHKRLREIDLGLKN